jgi:hypothetical protein
LNRPCGRGNRGLKRRLSNQTISPTRASASPKLAGVSFQSSPSCAVTLGSLNDCHITLYRRMRFSTQRSGGRRVFHRRCRNRRVKRVRFFGLNLAAHAPTHKCALEIPPYRTASEMRPKRGRSRCRAGECSSDIELFSMRARPRRPASASPAASRDAGKWVDAATPWRTVRQHVTLSSANSAKPLIYFVICQDERA